MTTVCGPSLFGSGARCNNYIKVWNGGFLAVEGSNTADKLMLSELRIKYSEILKSKVLLKKGQQNYILNPLGIGDNVVFVALKVIYDSKSVIEEDNYLTWSYLDGFVVNKIGSLMVLTGNTTNTVPQIMVSNPNIKYDVQLEVLIAINDCVDVDTQNTSNNLPFYATSQNIDILTLIGTTLPELVFIEFELVAEPNDSDEDTGEKKQKFEIPASYIISGVEQFNTITNTWQWIGGDKEESLLLLEDLWNKESTVIDVSGNNIDYFIYTHIGPKIGTRKLRLWRG
jgi:hypothetical protein